jgi:hypothetical protein
MLGPPVGAQRPTGAQGGRMTSDGLIFGAVVAARILVPLAIPRFPLPAMLLALVIDGIDQTIFQTFTSLDLSGYQSYDKALDVYYLSIAYVATLRNWTNLDAFGVSRFLYYYRLVGVVAFELSQVRALLLVFPNTFEYFFDFYEAVRVRWDPRKMSRRLVIGSAAFIWIFIKLPQEWWIHVAQLDMTDTLKTKVFGVPTTATWGEAIAASPLVIVVVAVALVLAAVGAWWLLKYRLPPADRPPTFDADAQQPPVDPVAVDATRRRIASRLFDQELLEKIVLVGLVSIIFGRMLPGVEASPLGIALGVAVLIVANGAVSDILVRRTRTLGFHSTPRQFVATLAINIGLVLVGQVVLDILRGPTLEHALVFVLLLSLIVTLYDRYRPIHVTRFQGEPGARVADPAAIPEGGPA